MTKNLKEKAINIKGKQYVQVSDRIIYFNETYPNGAIKTELVDYTESGRIIIKAIVMPDLTTPERQFTGYAQEVEGDGYINKTAALENCETSAVGRALAMMAIGVLDSVASMDEINKSNNQAYFQQQAKPQLKQATPNGSDIQSICEGCKGAASPQEVKYSTSRFQKVLCRKCQPNNK